MKKAKTITAGETVELKGGGSITVGGYAVLDYPVTKEQAQAIANAAIAARPAGHASCKSCDEGGEPKVHFIEEVKGHDKGDKAEASDVAAMAAPPATSYHIIWCD